YLVPPQSLPWHFEDRHPKTDPDCSCRLDFATPRLPSIFPRATGHACFRLSLERKTRFSRSCQTRQGTKSFSLPPLSSHRSAPLRSCDSATLRHPNPVHSALSTVRLLRSSRLDSNSLTAPATSETSHPVLPALMCSRVQAALPAPSCPLESPQQTDPQYLP